MIKNPDVNFFSPYHCDKFTTIHFLDDNNRLSNTESFHSAVIFRSFTLDIFFHKNIHLSLKWWKSNKDVKEPSKENMEFLWPLPKFLNYSLKKEKNWITIRIWNLCDVFLWQWKKVNALDVPPLKRRITHKGWITWTLRLHYSWIF